MPKYEYVCGACGAKLEIEQRMSESTLTICPECNAESLERLISRSNFALKGGGWYADGYGVPSKESSSDGDSSPTAPTSDLDNATEPTDSKVVEKEVSAPSDTESTANSDKAVSTSKDETS